MKVKACCCGHMNWEHRNEYMNGSCKVCGGLGCPRFHEVGEGHGRAFELFIAGCAAVLLCGAWAYRRAHPRTNPLKIAPLEAGPRTR